MTVPNNMNTIYIGGKYYNMGAIGINYGGSGDKSSKEDDPVWSAEKGNYATKLEISDVTTVVLTNSELIKEVKEHTDNCQIEEISEESVKSLFATTD